MGIGSAAAQNSADLTGEEIVEDAVEALGGKDNILAVDTMILSGDVEMQAVNGEMDLTLEKKRPNKARSEAYIPSMGTIISGYDGDGSTKSHDVAVFHRRNRPFGLP